MVGIIVVAHLGVAQEMVKVTRQIIPEATNFISVTVEQNEPPASIKEKISKAIEGFETTQNNDGILILTDMFGGTPSNVCLSFLSKPRVEVISGFNMPMLIKLASFKQDKSFEEMTTFIQQYGQRNIVIASHVLTGRTT